MSHTTPPAPRSYPRDEFDEPGPQVGRRGAHRAKASPVIAMLPVLLVVLATVAVIVATMTLLGGGTPTSSVAPVGGGPAATQPPATQPPATQPPATQAAATEPGPSSPAPAEPPASASDEPVDRTVPVTVLNGTATSGLAGEATRVLLGLGWAVAEAGNYSEENVPPTTVFYPRKELAATAAAVAEDLGGAATALTDDFGDDGPTVVLGSDYVP